jgi:uncharacterized protein (TIGR01319 family)
MNNALFVDFGSTYTKATVVDLELEEIKATASAQTTVQSGLMVGLQRVLAELYSLLGQVDFKYKVACSSAAGGLKIIAIGLVKELTVEAAKRAALGAGAKIVDVFAHELTEEDVERITKLHPDIILLAGGTDGGNKDVLIYNAQLLCQLGIRSPVIIAGNRVAAPEAKKILEASGFEVVIAENVMPQLNVLNVEDARLQIREIFLKKIILVKGLKKTEAFLDGVVLPTPAAVLKAAELLALGTAGEPGFGELMVLDPGGATTDIYSMADGLPTRAGVILKGLPEPFAKRTVEGDLGMRFSCTTPFEAAVKNNLIDQKDCEEYIKLISKETAYLPQKEEEHSWDAILGEMALKIALARHAGHLEVVYTPFGTSFLQYGKDLTRIKNVIGTGGVLIKSRDPDGILSKVFLDKKDNQVLKPGNPRLWLDKKYILAAMGLLAEIDPVKALRIMKKYLSELGGN